MKKNVPYSGYVFPSTGELIITKLSWFNYETVIESFRSLISEYPIPDDKKIALVIDNAPWHKKAYRLICTENKDVYSDIKEKILSSYIKSKYALDLVCRILTGE